MTTLAKVWPLVQNVLLAILLICSAPNVDAFPVAAYLGHQSNKARSYSRGNFPASSATSLSANVLVTDTSPPDVVVTRNSDDTSTGPFVPNSKKSTDTATVCVIGGGVSGLTAAMTVAIGAKGSKILLLEACERLGGRVQSDAENGFTFDRGFAVFIEEYPLAKRLLDYDKLNLGKFLPGALVKVQGQTKLARVSDPLRQPSYVLAALLAPIGSIRDKLRLLPLILNVRRKTIDQLFQEPETDTLTALTERWGFSEHILTTFFRPFLEGIYLAPLEQQSSRMFSFVFKMFSEGSATLPRGGMAAVSNQLEEKAMDVGVKVRAGHAVSRISTTSSGAFIVETVDGETRIEAQAVIVATDVGVAQKLLSPFTRLESSTATQSKITQRCVGCLYYSFEGKAPVSDPILILNGEGKSRGSIQSPINNVCFPSSVSKGYAKEGFGLCSVCILKDAVDAFRGREQELDRAVREQLSTWFPDYRDDILEKWKLRRIYYIPNAQPAQLGSYSASCNGGRDCHIFLGVSLPKGLFVCGDHQATASLNGALESGVNAGNTTADFLLEVGCTAY